LGFMAAGSRWGLAGVGVGLAVAHVVGLGVAGAITIRLVQCRWSDLVRTARPGVLLASTTGAAALVALHVAPVSDPLRLGMAVTAGLLTGAAVLPRLDPGLWQTLAEGIRGGRVEQAGSELI
jgi:hypothetical protein